MKKILKVNGQAMIETLIITIFLIMLCFAAFQAIVVVVNDLVYNEASFSIARTAAISRNENIHDNIRKSALYILGDSVLSKNRKYEIAFNKYALNENGEIAIYEISLQYILNIMLGSFFNNTGLGTSYLEREAVARLIASPDPEYFERGYPGGFFDKNN